MSTTLVRDFGIRRTRYRAGISAGRLATDTMASATRTLAFAEYGGAATLLRGRRYASLAVALHGASGRTAGDDWRRATTTATLALGTEDLGVRGSVGYGVVTRGAGPFERFLVGGLGSPLVDDALLSQRVSLPAAPVGVRGGRELYSYRASLLGLGPLTPYYAGVSTRGGFADAFRVVGAEASLSLGDAPIIALPSVRALAGVGYTLDAPFRKKTRAYLSVEYRP